jgi:hypothetical protein
VQFADDNQISEIRFVNSEGGGNEKIFINYFYIEYSRRFLSREKHPRFNQPYFQLFYSQPI